MQNDDEKTKKKNSTYTSSSTNVDNAYTAFNAVDDLVKKNVLGSDGAAAWQKFKSSNNNKKQQSSISVAPKAPLKSLDRAVGFTSWNDERIYENQIRKDIGTTDLDHSGYTTFSGKNDDNDNDNEMTTKERRRIEQRKMKLDQEYYIPSKTFQGWKWDYIFTTKDGYGTGYYYDGMDSLKKLRGDTTLPAYKATGTAIATKKRKEEKVTEEGENAKTTKTKKKKKKKTDKSVTIINDPNNPLEQVAKVLEQQRQKQQQLQLPTGWEAATDTITQKIYYYNRTTGERTWEQPSKEETTSLWQSTKDPSTGKEYYYNIKTGETVWGKTLK